MPGPEKASSTGFELTEFLDLLDLLEIRRFFEMGHVLENLGFGSTEFWESCASKS